MKGACMHLARVLSTLIAAGYLAGCATSSTQGEQRPVSAQKSAWPMYQHSPDRNAVFEGYSFAHDWSYDTKSKVNSGLALVGNTLLFTTFSHKLIALDVRSGRELWQAPVKNIAMSTPIVAGNTVYVGTGKSGILDRKWNLLLRIKYPKQDVWGVPGGDEIAAFDLNTGKARWRFGTLGEDMPSAVYDGGRLIFANGDRHAYALRGDTGQQLWVTDIGGISTMASAVTAGQSVVVAACSHGMKESWALALDFATGKTLWRSPYGHCDAAPAYGEDKVFVSSVSPGDSSLQGKTVVAALNAKTGKPVWVYRDPTQGLWSIVGSDEAAVAGAYANGIYYQSAPFTSDMIAFDAASGKIRWRFATSGPVKMSPVIAKGRLYVGDTAGLFYTLNARTGAVIELRGFKQPFTTSPPILAGNKILVVNGASVDAIPVSGRPQLGEPVGWGVVSSGGQKKQ